MVSGFVTFSCLFVSCFVFLTFFVLIWMDLVKKIEMSDETLLEEGPLEDFHGAKLQIQQDLFQSSRSPSSLGDDSESVARLSLSPEANSEATATRSGKGDPAFMDENSLKPAVLAGADVVSPIISVPHNISETLKRNQIEDKDPPCSDVMCQKPFLAQQDAKDFFTYRDGLVETAVTECINSLVSVETDGEVLGSWLLTEISLWDNDKERLILLSSQSLTTIKYDFIALKQLEYRKVPLNLVDTLVIGDLVYPSGSLVPRLNGLATGVVTVVKGCLLKPLQERWTRTTPADKDFCAPPFDFISFEPRARNMRGLRAMWNRGEPLTFSKKWNPFNNEIPWATYTSHPLLWHKDSGSKAMYDVEDFARKVVMAVEHAQQTSNEDGYISCQVEHKPIVLQNYIGISSLIHNRNALGFFKVRGKFSF